MHPRKILVRHGYDAVAEACAQARPRREHDNPADWQRELLWLERFRRMLPAGGRVLDLGCGNGEPILSGLSARGFRVTGVDLSHEQARRARTLVPAAAIVEADLAEVAFAAASFDGVIAYDSIWHVPRHEHAAVFARMRPWIVDGGALLATLGAVATVAPDAPGLVTDLLGAPTFYDAWTLEVALAHVRAAGFDLVDHHCHYQPGAAGGHLVVLATARRAEAFSDGP